MCPLFKMIRLGFHMWDSRVGISSRSKVVSVQVPQVAGSPVWWPGVLAVRRWRPDDLGSWSLGGPNAKVATCGAEDVPKRRMRRTPAGSQSVVWARWGGACQGHCLASCASCSGGPSIR